MYPRILVPLDGSADAGCALQEAVALARALGSDLVLMHVVDTYELLLAKTAQVGFDDARDALLTRGTALLEASCMTAREASVACEVVLCEVMSSRVAAVIVDEAARHHCSLVVMGTHGRNGRTQLVLGSDAERVVHASLMPVLLVSQGRS